MLNLIKNYTWFERDGSYPTFFKTDEQIHFDNQCVDGYKVASLQLVTENYERLVYTEKIFKEEANFVSIGLIIRGMDVKAVKYKVAFYNEREECIGICSHNIASEITPHFKRICVTYPIKKGCSYIRVGWEFEGLVTGVSCFCPSVEWV